MIDKRLSITFEVSLLALFFILFPFVRKDILIFAFYTVTYFYIVRYKQESIKYLGLSTIISFVYMMIAYEYYVYTPDLVKFFGLEIYPLLAWSLGLFIVREIYSYARSDDDIKSIMFISIYYVVTLIIVETVSYHVIGFRNPNPYPGLPICDCIHAPMGMQIYYLAAGPVFYALTLLLDKFIKKD